LKYFLDNEPIVVRKTENREKSDQLKFILAIALDLLKINSPHYSSTEIHTHNRSGIFKNQFS